MSRRNDDGNDLWFWIIVIILFGGLATGPSEDEEKPLTDGPEVVELQEQDGY